MMTSFSRPFPRLLVLLMLLSPSSGLQAAIKVVPSSIILDSPETTQQLLVAESDTTPDLTRQATYQSANPKIALVDETGLVRPVAEGKTEIVVAHKDQQARIPVEVKGLLQPTPVSFASQIIPILNKSGCNAGGCHGKAEGQAGFKLSVFGFDPMADHKAIIMEGRGRRTFPASPANSLLLLKGTGLVPHGGGRKIQPDSLSFRRVVRWIAEGQRYDNADTAALKSIEVEPALRVLPFEGTQQLRVTAIDVNGNRRCVTAEAEYDSNATTIAGADHRGLVQAGSTPGEAAILVRYMGQVTICRVTIPRPGVKFARPPENNFIDRHVWNKLERLGIPPSDIADDATFLRRVTLDVIGTLPSAAETREFLADKDANKRAKLIDRLLDRPEYADFWAMLWADILRVDKDAVTPQGAVAMTRWLRKQFAENRPYDEMARAVVLAQGSTTSEGPAAFYKVLNNPELVSRSISQVFLGVRIECAQCHHHPSERWGQEDYFALAGLFTGVTRKPLPNGSEAIMARGGLDLKHPRTKLGVPAKPLGAAELDLTSVSDRRSIFADWMVAQDNPYFAEAVANRLWSHYFGRGLVEPLDDLRATNPASNEPLLAELAKNLREAKYDIKAFTKTLLLSRAYQLGHEIPANRDDEQNFSHATYRTLTAEVLLDAVCQTTGVGEKFNGWPEGYRAIQVWDNRMPSYFFRIFGRPVRFSVCECERGSEPSITQALHLMNSPEIADKIRNRKGTARALADSTKTPTEIVDELFLSALARFPTEKERTLMLDTFKQEGVDRRTAVEDVLWALLNMKDFIYNR